MGGLRVRRARVLGYGIVAAVMAVGLQGGLIEAAGAHANAGPGLSLYVSTTGNDLGNPCTSKALPCATITRALTVEAESSVGGTIHVAAGTYASQLSIGPANTGVTIVGAGAKKTVIEPPVGVTANATTDPNSAKPIVAVVEVSGGASNVTLENLGVDGAGEEPFLHVSGCTQQFAGIYYDDASGKIASVSVTGIDMPGTPASPPGAFGCPGEGIGVYVASDNAAPTVDVAMSQLSMTTKGCTTKTTIPLPADVTYTSEDPEFLPVSGIPKCQGWNSGSVLIDGALFQANAYGSHALELVGTTPYALPAGATVNVANPFEPAYDADGIVCADAHTNCSISASTVQGAGPTDLTSQTGIEILGASATVAGNTISQNSYTGGGASAQGVGIRVVDDGTVDLTGNTVTANDQGIDAAWVASSAPAYPVQSTGTLNITDGRTTAGQTTLTAPTSAPFLPSDVGRAVSVTENVSTTVASGANGLPLPQGTIDVVATTGFVVPGTIQVVTTSGTEAVTCTGTATTPAVAFTGCSGGTGTLATGNAVTQTDSVPLGYVAQYVSPEVEILSQPAPVTGTNEAITLGALPGTWLVSGNTTSDATALGLSAGQSGYGDGILLDSTDSCDDGFENATVVLQGNTADDDPGTGIVTLGASCALIGGTTSADANTASDDQIGLMLSGPGTANDAACMSSSPCGPSYPGYTSTQNIVEGNDFTGDAVGVVAAGITAPPSSGGPPAGGTPGSTDNAFAANTWTTNTVANAVDFDAWGGPSCAASPASNTLLAGLTSGFATSVLYLTTPVTVAAGAQVQISGSPTIDVLVAATVSDTQTLPVMTFTPTVDYSAGDTLTIGCVDTTLGSALTPGTATSSVTLASPVTLPEGSILALSETGQATFDLIVTAPVTDATTVAVSPFTPTASYGSGTVALDPFGPTDPEVSGYNTWAVTNTCVPSAGGSATFQGLTFDAGYVSC